MMFVVLLKAVWRASAAPVGADSLTFLRVLAGFPAELWTVAADLSLFWQQIALFVHCSLKE